MWNVLKFTYNYAGESRTKSWVHAYLHLAEAEEIFDHLRLAYEFDAPVRVKGGKRIKVSGVSLYTSFREDRKDAEAEVLAGAARLIQEAHEIQIDLD